MGTNVSPEPSTIVYLNTESANVYKSPSTGSPVLGVARRGAVLEVTRVLGSWVKVVWPDAQHGTGYVHVSMGLIALGSTPVPNRGDPDTLVSLVVPLEFRLDHFEHLLSEGIHQLLGVDRSDAADHPGAKVFLDAVN